MANVAVEKVQSKEMKPLPLFEELEKRFEEVRRHAFGLFEQRGRELGHALDDWLRAEHEVMGWPVAELRESDSQYDIDLTLPGYEPKDVQVTATPSEIAIHAGVQAEKKGESGKVAWSEFKSNDVYRRFGFPEGIDVDSVRASIDKGMLHVVAAKEAPSKVRPIGVKAA